MVTFLVAAAALLIGSGLTVLLRPCRFCNRVRHDRGCLLRDL